MSTFTELEQLLTVAQTNDELLAIRQQAIDNARRDPCELAPIVFATDQQEPMRPEAFHRQWIADALAYDRYLLIAARGHAKSEWISGVLALALIGANPAIRILFITTDDDQAAMHTRRIRKLLESDPAVKAIFPDLPPMEKSTELEFKLRGPGAHLTWRAAGINSISPGPRADVIIVDDAVSFKNSRTPALRETIYRTFTGTVLPMLNPIGGKILCVGTPWFEGDLTDRLRKSGTYYVGVYPAIDAQGQLLWPARFSQASLDQARREMGEFDYSAQLLCTIKTDVGKVFQRSWFEIVPQAPKLVEVWLVVDTAFSTKKTADYAGFLTIGKDVQGTCYVLHAERGKWGPTELQQQCTRRLAAAKATYGRFCMGLLAEQIKENSVLQAWMKGQPVTLISHGNLSKADRADAVIPTCEHDGVKLVQGSWNGQVLDELADFTRDDSHESDEHVDNLVYGVAKLLRLNFTLHKRTGQRVLVPLR